MTAAQEALAQEMPTPALLTPIVFNNYILTVSHYSIAISTCIPLPLYAVSQPNILLVFDALIDNKYFLFENTS
jgi:hypothetical protein